MPVPKTARQTLLPGSLGFVQFQARANEAQGRIGSPMGADVDSTKAKNRVRRLLRIRGISDAEIARQIGYSKTFVRNTRLGLNLSDGGDPAMDYWSGFMRGALRTANERHVEALRATGRRF